MVIILTWTAKKSTAGKIFANTLFAKAYYLWLHWRFIFLGNIMLELRPNCENCNKSLPANATDAMICSYECTFCCDCVEQTLENVCPNCGGGFVSRPIRPYNPWRAGVSLQHQPASDQPVSKPVDKTNHRSFKENLIAIPPHER